MTKAIHIAVVIGLCVLPAAAVPPNDGLLAGPKVDSAAARPTLVDRDFEGRLKRLETSPEEAALRLLSLDPETRQACDELLAERTAILDRIVSDNIPLLLKFQTARQAGDTQDLADLTKDLVAKLEPLRAQGAFKDRVKNALPEGQRAEFERLVSEYWKAALEESRSDAAKEAKKDGRKPSRFATGRQALQKEIALAIGQEIKRSYERTIGQKLADFESLLSEMALSPESERKVRNLATEHAQKNLGKATPAQNRDLFFRMLGEMTPEERARAIKAARER